MTPIPDWVRHIKTPWLRVMIMKLRVEDALKLMGERK